MKLTCSRTSLLSALQIVGGVVPSRTPKEILKNVKLTLGDGRATLIGTDQEVGVRYEIPGVETDSAGDVLLPTQRVTLILREVQDDSIHLELEEDGLWIRSSRSEFKLSSPDPAEFPDVARFEDEAALAVSGLALRQGIQRTIFSVDTEGTRYALGGILLDVQGEELSLAATDSRRLAVVRLACRREGDLPEDLGRPVVPAKAMQLIERSIQDDEQEVLIAVHTNDVLVRSGATTIYARLVEGRFPNYRDVIPNDFASQIELVAGPFLSAVRQSMIVTNEESRGVDFTFKDGNLMLKSVGADVGSSRVDLPVSYSGDELTITFDPRFVADFLRTLDAADSLTLNLNSPQSAAVFRAEDDYTYVVMPLAQEG